MVDIIAEKEFNTPILLLVFNKEKETNSLFKIIKKIKPPILYIACDGPRENKKEDFLKVQKVKNIFKNINWECDVKTLYRDKNLGCRIAVSSAIEWFFNQVEMGIILEDDCIPSLSFFKFCDQMLIEYKSNKNIFMISGHNRIGTWCNEEKDYFFSNVGCIWGWATWRESWRNFDIEMSNLEILNKENFLEKQFNEKSGKIIKTILQDAKNKIDKKKIDSWAYPWFYTRVFNNGISLMPSLNLVKNIGFNSPEATHYKNKNKVYDVLENYELTFPLKKNDSINIDRKYDDLIIKKIHKDTIFSRIKKIIKKIWLIS